MRSRLRSKPGQEPPLAETETTDAPTTEASFTQADVDRVVADRLKRERAKYADYDDLKSKAAAADQASEAGKGETQKLTEQLAKMQADLDDERRRRHIIEVGAEKGLTPAHVKRLTGTSREELEASADELLVDFPLPAKGENDKGSEVPPPPPGGRPREQLKPGNGDPDVPVEETDVKALGERMFRR